LKLQPDYSPAVLNQAVLYQYYVVNRTNALAKYREYLRMKPDAAGAAAATEAVRVLEAELQPRIVAAPVTNAPIATNRFVAMTNRPSAHTNIATAPHTNAPTLEIAHVATNKPAAPVKTVAVAATNKPPEVATAPPTKTNYVAMAPPVITNAPPPPKIEEKPVEKVEPAKPLEVVTLDEEPKLAIAKDIAPPKSTVTKPAPAAISTAPKSVQPAPTKETNTAAAEELPPLIRPARREENESSPSLTSKILHKANPVNWFRRSKDKEEEKPETSEKLVAKKTETPKESGVKELPEPPKEAPKEPVPEIKPEPVFARYPYQTTPLPKAGNRATAEPLFNEAVAAHQEGKLGKAMDGYRAALRQDPRYFDAELNLGIAAAQATDLSLALASLEDAVRMNPKSAEARYQFAIALRRANYPLDAVNELKTLIEDNPRETRAYLALGNLYAQILNKPDEAITNYQKVLDLAPQHPQAPQIRAWLSQH
jgi:tetratricopeptide (TPR) repeat protein